MERNYKLYVHIAPNGKRYYGITMQKPERRWRDGKGYRDNRYFTRAVNKYGWDNIEHIVIYNDLTESEAKELEQYYIQWYDTTNPQYGMNISLGGESGNHSEATKQKISNANKGKQGYWRGKHLSEETKKKLSEAHKGKINPKGKQSPCSKPIICTTTKEIYYGTREAERQCGVDRSSISRCCKGKQKSAGKLPTGEKLVWRYIDIIEL